jgi:hypothetical protein
MFRLVIVWIFLMALLPAVWPSADRGSELIRYTIRLSLVHYFIAAILLLRAKITDWKANTRIIRLARGCWTLAWLIYVIHVALAFHYAHRWSHADAMQHTQDVSGVAEGIFVSHLFTLLWMTDVLSWWLRPDWYAGRPAWIDRTLHGFMVFIIFNGTVIFESGFVRWFGAIMFGVLALLAGQRLSAGRRMRVDTEQEASAAC